VAKQSGGLTSAHSNLAKVVSPTCHPLGLQMSSTDLDPIYYMVSWSRKSQHPNGISINSAVFAQYMRVTITHTDAQTTLRVTFVAIGLVCNVALQYDYLVVAV